VVDQKASTAIQNYVCLEKCQGQWQIKSPS